MVIDIAPVVIAVVVVVFVVVVPVVEFDGLLVNNSTSSLLV